jgi:hypothetical protein
VRTATRRLFAALALALAALAYFELAWPPRYEFPPPTPFKGDRWYNPYAGYRGGGLLANFHAHSEVWGGLTFGDTPRHELYALYKERGYDVIGISDYMTIAPPQGAGDIYLSAYEHGYTPGRHHQTVIGARRVSWFDYPLGGSVEQKQDVLDRLRPEAQFLIVNHPTKADSYAIEDFAELTGYDALEVASKYGVWEDYWDAALSAGRPVWGVASDDGHASVEEGVGSHIGIAYLEIHSVERTSLGVLAALHAGRFHAVYTRDGKPPVALELCELEGDQIRFYGQNGRLLRAEHNRSEAFYTPSPDDTYVRVEVQVLARKAMLYLNPLIRWDGVALPKPEARFLVGRSWAIRAGGALLFAVAIIAWRGTARSLRRSPGLRADPGQESARAEARR